VERGALTASTASAPRLAAALVRAGRATLDLLLPPSCVVCDAPLAAHEAGVTCGRCWSRLDTLPHPQCARCGHPLGRDAGRHACRWCECLPPFVRAARSVCFATGGSGGEIVHALKYHAWHAAADGMAARMARLPWPADVVRERTVCVPVPLAAVRLRERGFNQSALLAERVAAQWALPYAGETLMRTRSTVSQTRLTPGDRLSNVAGAFRAGDGTREMLRGAHVVLIDDVVTTAATLNACAAALCAGGARIVSYLTFGRARSARDLR
jgi:ComF family protein